MILENLNDEEILVLLNYYVNQNELTKALDICEVRKYELSSISFIHAAILCQIGLYDRAIALYLIVLEADPNNELCKFQLGVAQFFSSLHNNESAFETWSGLDDFLDFSEAFKALAQREFSEAERRLENFIINNKKYPELNADAESLLVKIRKNVDEAVVDSEEMTEHRVNNEVESLLSIYKQ
ncbi:conserved hypothetical protein [Vibrio chagasii]|uniref:Uncharacterized protein n=1 Tax=Vibrio chagasii TaxID=170679 RepID=A0A7V7NQF1_9VIBR|nr:hypothetical protein [Vibrio chagasii]KAB0470290.1 hypothetical protein F7Q91_22625 [Vibrio chagasii]CAH7135637.1 conserved hypothetical protein [Vibrio chagasii]